MIDQPQPNTRGVKTRGSFEFHMRSLMTDGVGQRKSYGTLRNVPVFFMFEILSISVGTALLTGIAPESGT